MKKPFSVIISFLFLFNSVCAGLVFADGNVWDEVNLNYKTPRDSVDWGNIDLVSKPPKTPQSDPDHSGEKTGITGPVIAFGGKGKDEALVVYDACGTPTAVVTKEEAKSNPDAAEQKLESACSSGTNEYFSTYFKGQLLTDNDLGQLTDYAVGKNRLPSRALFGDGIVCGLDASTKPGAGTVTVDPGYALDAAGNEITVDTQQGTNTVPEQKQPETVSSTAPDSGIYVPPPSDAVPETTPASDAPLPASTPAVDVRQTEDAPQFQVDGVSSQPDIGGGPGSMASMEEIQVNSSGIAAEYGRSAGGVINTVTKRNGSACSETGAIAPRVGFTYDITGNDKAALRTTFQNAVPPAKWSPKVILVVQSGISRQDLRVLVRIIIARLIARSGRQDFFEDCRGKRGVYIIEIVLVRRVQDAENKIRPDDEYYLRGGSRGGSGGGGFSVGFGGISIGKSSRKAVIRDQWGLQRVGFSPRVNKNSAWNEEDGSKKNIIVAVIDSGMDMTHPDAPEYFWVNPGEVPDNGVDDDLDGYVDDINGWNFLGHNNDLTDIKGHGTFVTGIIAAKTDNKIGIAGINPGAQIMPLKVGDEYGNANSLDISRAIRYAVDHGARVINISLGEEGLSQLEQLAVNYAYTRGCIVVVAAGNQSGDISDYGPAACRRVLAVNAMDIEGTKSVICNTGANVALIAPGEEIYSLQSKDAEWEGPSAVKERLYWRQSGTSFAAPIVAATASLILAKSPRLTAGQAESILLDTADDIFMKGWDAESGCGLLNASKALRKNADETLVVRPVQVFIERDGRKEKAVYIFGVIRGSIKEYTVETGKDIETKKWETVVNGTAPVEYGLLAKLDGKILKKKEFVVRIKATDKNGKVKLAHLPVSLKDKK